VSPCVASAVAHEARRSGVARIDAEPVGI
jgi:hypothetical protein